MSSQHTKQGLFDSQLRMKLLDAFRDSFPLGTTDKNISQLEKEVFSKLREVAAEGRYPESDSGKYYSPKNRLFSKGSENLTFKITG